ncbi:MAG TPA: DUF3857 domain-containing protein [Candidatus Acidoferrum sp.]|nr:DUF3857 domain-containing protein [Candidatus Acidoferrum sp.]
MSYRRVSLLVIFLLLGFALQRARPVSGDEWQPITQEELKMTSEPKAPGAPAIILYRQIDRDDSNSRTPHEFNYIREKIFTEEGRKYADVEIPFVKEQANIHSIKARTIRPDGTIANFDGKIYEKEIVKARGLKYLAKTFTLSDVQTGSVIEYHYTVDYREGYVYDSHWTLSEELFAKHGKYSLKPYGEFALQWSWPNGLPGGTAPPTKQGDTIRMEARDIPAFQIEDDMPPEDSMKFKVDFVYTDGSIEKEPEKFWKKRGKKLNDEAEGFVGKRKAMEQAVGEIVLPSDPPEVKLQKIYTRVQRLRNTTYEPEKMEQQQKREKEKDVNNVEELWKRGYGTSIQIPWVFLALARAAGFEAYPVWVSSRSSDFFNPNMMRASDLNSNVVLVKLNGKDLYLDPGSAFTPFGLLPWGETGVRGLKLDKDGGAWVTTPIPESSVSLIERKAGLKLTSDGSLEGKLTVTYSGLEAAWRRVEERNEDEAHRKKFLEDEVKETIPAGIEVDITNKPEWTTSASTLVAQFDLKVPGWVSGAGRRALMPVGLFSAPEKHVCEHTARVHPVYFHYMSEKVDDVRIELPLDWRVGSLPEPQTNDGKVILYSLKVANENGTLHLERRLRRDLISLEQKYYPALRNFYQTVRTGDEQQIVLQPGGISGRN